MGLEQTQNNWLEHFDSDDRQLSASVGWILDQISDAIALFDASDRLVYFNRPLLAIWNISTTWLQSQPTWKQIQDALVAKGTWSLQQGQQFQQALAKTVPSSFTLAPIHGESLTVRIRRSKAAETLVIFQLTSQPAAKDAPQQNLRSQLFAEISLKIRQSLQIDDILQTTATEVRNFLQCDRTLIYRLQPNNSGAVVTEAALPGYSSLLGYELDPAVFPGDYQQLYRLGAIRVIDASEPDATEPSDDLTESDRHNIALLHQLEVKTKLVVPILARDLLWGLLIVHQCDKLRRWSEGEIELLQQLADQVGIALAQAQLVQALQESEERFRVMANTAPVMLWVAGTDAKCNFFNRPWLEFTGRAIDRETGDGWTEGVHPDDLSTYMGTYLSAFQARQRFSVEYRLRRFDGAYRWILAIGVPRFLPDGNFAGYIGSCIDITERKQAEAEIHRALEREKELNELKSRFVSMTSHEFRTPLSTILLSAELLERYSMRWPDHKKLKHLQRIQSAVQRMTQLLDDILLLGKAEAGKLEFTPIPLKLEEFCQELIEEVQITASSDHNLTFSREGDPVEVYLDKKLLRSILSNLLSNAIKYSFKGSNVQFQLSYRENEVVFQVHDRGIGIPLDDQKHIFESFHRARNVINLPGTGLGLAIAKRCIDLHGGQVEVESVVDRGTTFTVTLPLVRP